MKFLKSLLFFILYFYSTMSESSGNINDAFREAFSLIKECGNSDVIICLKEKIIKMIEKLPKEFQLLSGVTVKESAKAMKKLSPNFDEIVLPTNKSERAEIVNKVLLDKITEFVDNHLIEIKAPAEKLQQYFEEGRKKKKNKSIMPYLILFKAKAVAIGAFFFKFISLMALKALILSKMALALTVGIGLKRLSDYSTRYPSALFEFHQPANDYNYWRRIVTDDIPYNTSPIRNIPYPMYNTNQGN